MADPQKYRDDAARLRAKAEATADPELKRQLLEIAKLHDWRADDIEKRQPKS
jgi:hypothetical protein